MQDFEKLILFLDEKLRQGETQTVARELAKACNGKIPRPERLKLASLARRIDASSIGLKLLAPLVRPLRGVADATPHELAEYAGLLIKIGSTEEAERILVDVDATQVPTSLLYRAYGFVSTWSHAEAVPLFERYLQSDIPEYAFYVGRVNLISARLNARLFDGLDDLIDDTLRGVEARGFGRLLGNCHELKCHSLIERNELDEARASIEAAKRFFGPAPTQDQFFFRQWQSFLAAIDARSIQPFEAFRKEALAAGQWESVRETDLYRLKISFDQAIFERLYFGTPYESYREKIRRTLDRRPERDTMIFGEEDGRARVLDLETGTCDVEHPLPGLKIHQLFNVLLSDFYRPKRLGSVFTRLFPGEYFDIHSSPDRVNQIFRRARRWLELNEIPVVLACKDGHFGLTITGSFAFRIKVQRPSVSNEDVTLARLRASFGGDRWFTPRQVRERLDMRRTVLSSFLTWAVEEGHLVREGGGRSIRYRHALLSRIAKGFKPKSNAA